MGYCDKHLKRFFWGISLLFFNGISSLNAQCVVASTDFETSSDLCCPVLTSDKDGWYDEDLDWTKLCKSDMFIGPEYVRQGGIGGLFFSESSNDLTGIDKLFHQHTEEKNGGYQYGYSIVTAQPKLIHSFCKANKEPNNMFVNIGSSKNCPILTYSLYGLNPGTQIELSFTLCNLLDPTYFDHLATNVCGTGAGAKTMGDFITKYKYEAGKITGDNLLTFGVVSNTKNIEFNTGYNNAIQETSLENAVTKTVGFGESTTITYPTTVPASGSITFYFYRASDCFQIPIGIDDIKVTGSLKPLISTTGNPCPEQPLRITTKQSYPKGTTFEWKESITGQESSEMSFNFVPDSAETDYSITLGVTMPGCTSAGWDTLLVHSKTCCENDGKPMGMTNLFYDDFGTFTSDNSYEWTDRYGITHTETIPAGQVHTARSHPTQEKIPFVKAYNIIANGAHLSVPFAGDEGKSELWDHEVYFVSKAAGYEQGVPNDNSGTETGGMLQFDLNDDGSQDDFFEIDIDHICTGKKITFGADFASISEWPGSIEVLLEHNGKTLQSEFKYFENGAEGWQHAGGNSFEIKSEDVNGAKEVTVKMKVRHYGYKADNTPITSLTRDYGIDNIVFQVCTPPDVNMESSVSTGKDLLDLCTKDVLTLTSITSDAVKKFYLYSSDGTIDPNKKVGYVYQYTFQDPSTESDANPITWNTLHQEEVVETDSFNVSVEEYWDKIFSQLDDDPKHEKRIYFRVVVGEYSDLIADQSWKKASAFSPCRKISISTIPVIAGLNCAACEKVKEATIISADPSTIVKTNSTNEKEVVLCPGEIAQLTTKPFAPTDPTVMGIKVGPDNEPRKYEASWHKGSKNATGKRGSGYTPGDETSSYNVTWEDADWYYLLVKDIEFPGDDGQSCWIWDSIHVIAADKPTADLLNPDPFCEGTLETEPIKEIPNYDIFWYTDEDTLTLTTEPIVSMMLAADPNKTFYYVLKDNTTLCRSDVKKYVVTVNEIPSVHLDGTVADFCATVSDPTPKSPEATTIPSLPNPVDDQLSIDWYTDKAMSTPATTDLSTLTGNLDPYTYYYKVTSAEGCSDTSHIVFKAKPTAVVKPSAEPICDKTTISVETTPETASVQWGNAKTDKTFDISTAAEAGLLTVTATATDYCSSAEGSISADFYESPAKLTTSTVQYLKTETITDILTHKADAVTGKTSDGTIMWLGQFKDETEPNSTAGASSSTPTPSMENPTSTTDETYYYWVFQQINNPDGTTCQSELTKLTVMILGSPAPFVSDTVYCLNSTPADLTKNVIINQMDPNKTYELVWYDAQTGGTGNTTPPAISTTTAGDTTYYVSQRDVNSTSNESSRMPIKVTIYDVPAPAVDPVSDYCVGDIASPLTTQLTKDETNFLMADRLVWTDGETTNTTFTPNTEVNDKTTYTYSAKQYYKMSSGEECESEETTLTVTVNFTSVPGDATVSFVAAEVTSDNKTFPAITTKNWVEESGYTYYYALEGTNDFQNKVPQPIFNVNDLNGNTKNIRYDVYRVDNATDCKSELSTITVTISDALPPIVANVLYCEGEALANLTAKRNPQTSANKAEEDYTLIWYGTTKPSSTTDPGTEGDSYPLQGNATTNPTGEVTTTTYYVAQRDDKTKAVSPAQEIKVIVYPTPILSVSTPPTVCETEVDLASSVSLTNEVSGMNYKETYFEGEGNPSPMSSSKVMESGVYGVQITYDAKVNSGELCKSTIEKINVTVDTLSVLTENVSTCPDMSARLTCEVKTNVSSEIKYAWTGDGGDNGNTAEFVTRKFIGGNYGDHFPYSLTVSAGSCSEVSNVEVILGEGPIVGTLTISDPTNTQLPTKVYTNSLTSEEYYYCGGNVTITPAYEGNGDYQLTTPSGASISTVPFTMSEAGVYKMTFTNGCPTSITFKLVDAQINLSNTTPALGLCEGDKFTSSVMVTPIAGIDYSIAWKKDDVAIDGLTSLSYTINEAVAENSGHYTVEANRKGCVDTTEIGNLKVTGTINVTLPEEPTICEGEETELVITDIKPVGTTIEWQSDPTIMTETNSERVTVRPPFKSTEGHQSTYTYHLSARNESCEKPYQVSVKVDESLKGTIDGTNTICEGFSSKITAKSYDATTYLWTTNGSTDTVTTAEILAEPLETTTYKVDMTRGTCTAQDEIMVVVTTNPKILSMDSVGIRDRQVITDHKSGTGVFTYWMDGNKSNSTNSDIIQNLAFGSHIINVVDNNGCTSSFQFSLNPPEITIPEFFTPNGDGIHDSWIIDKLAEVYPNAIVNIFDRYGKLVGHFFGDDSDGWDGTYNGISLPSTDYWYMIDIEEIERKYTGHFTLIRR